MENEKTELKLKWNGTVAAAVDFTSSLPDYDWHVECEPTAWGYNVLLIGKLII